MTLTGKHILISGPWASRSDVLLAEFAKACGDKATAAIDLACLTPNGNPTEVQVQIQSALGSLGNHVDVFVIGARIHLPYGQDPIWELPLNEWEAETAHSGRHTLAQIKAFLQHRVQCSKAKGGAGTGPFSIVVLGYRREFDVALEPLLEKIQRDISWLHHDASVSFLDFEISGRQVTKEWIIAAIGIFASKKTYTRVVSIDDIPNLNHSKIDSGRGGIVPSEA